MLEWTGEKDDISAILFFEKSSEIQDIYWEYIYIYIYFFYFRGETALTDWLNMSISTELVSHTRKSLMSCGLA